MDEDQTRDGQENTGGPADPLFIKLKRWFKADRDHSAKWRKEAEEDFAFVAGDQWSEQDIQKLKADMRPVITFNRVLPVINSVSGHEINSKQEVRYIPREPGDVQVNELLTEGSRWFRDLADADDEDTEAFYNAIVCGMGWTDTTLDFDDNEDGDPVMDSPDPLEMYWDKGARKKNLSDRRRGWRVKSYALSEAQEMFPGKSRADLHAAWAQVPGDGDAEDQESADRYEDDANEHGGEYEREVTLVHCEYKTKKTVYVVADPMTGQTMEMGVAKYRQLKSRMDALGMPVHSTRKQSTVVMQAWIGGKVLDHREGLCRTHFRYQCVTAYSDRKNRTFFGLVRGMKDPQRWANKWLVQSLDILNSQAKGGIIVEEGAVDDMRKFEREWTRPDKITVVPQGTLSGPNPKIMPKPQAQFPAGFIQLMEFAISSIRDVPGVSVEMLGMREADQAASLEMQRRQAGMTILAPLFANLKRYRHDQGEVMLYIIQHYLSDGRLVRIGGEGMEKYVPLVRQTDVRYDIIVDDMPTSPNQKEMVWSMIGGNFWSLPPNMQMALLEYSPFPTSVVQKVRDSAQQESQGPMAQLQQRMAMLEAQLKEADVGLKQAQTAETIADARKTAMETGQDGSGGQMMADMMRMRTDAAIKARGQDIEAGIKTRGQDMDAQRDMMKALIAAKTQRDAAQEKQNAPNG